MDEDTRFRRALKSPLVMIGLCLIAGIAVYHNVIQSTMDSSLPISVASLSSPSELTPTTSIPSLAGYEEIATQWIAHPKRDPFAPVSAAKWLDPSSSQSSTSIPLPQRPDETSPSKLTLKAIAIEADHRSAVINRQVVYEGETIEGYQIESIQLKGVWLTRHGKKQLLTFATNTTT